MQLAEFWQRITFRHAKNNLSPNAKFGNGFYLFLSVWGQILITGMSRFIYKMGRWWDFSILFFFFSGWFRYQFMHNMCTEPSVQEQINTLDNRVYVLGNYVITATTIPPNRKYTSVQFLLPTSAALHFPFTLLKKKKCICYVNSTTNVTSWVMVM